MMSIHTPGPWVSDDYQILHGNKIIANCRYGQANPNHAADARLIASAPDLLEALKNIVSLDGGESPDLWHFEAAFNAARQVIAKATGAA